MSTCVGYLIDNIKNNDTNLRSDIAIICINMNGMRAYFETTIDFFLPMDSSLKQRNNFNRNAQISDVNIRGKIKIKSGVGFYCYNKDE